jgi:hypothetical protein
MILKVSLVKKVGERTGAVVQKDGKKNSCFNNINYIRIENTMRHRDSAENP